MLITNHLHIYIPKKKLIYLVSTAKNNFFNYLYTTSPYVFYKREKGFLFKVKLLFSRKLNKLSYEEAKQVYEKSGFAKTLTILKDPTYLELFTNYEIISCIDERELIPIYLKDFKKFLQICDLTLSDFYNFSLIYDQNQQKQIGKIN